MMGVARRSLFVIALIAAAAGASAEENTKVTSSVTNLDRMWYNFNREAATVGDGGIWVELRGIKLNKDDPKIGLNGYPVNDFERKNGSELTEISGGRFDLIGAYGLGNAELGIGLPLVLQESLNFANGDDQEHASFGDMTLYGKFKLALTENWAWAPGLEMSIPTGRESVMLGSGDLGLNPFVSTRYEAGRLAVGAHLGFLLNTGSQPSVFNWSVQGIARANSHFALRTEVSGEVYNAVGNSFNIISIYPGLDFNLTENFIIRPEGMAGLTHQAFDWGIGIGFVFTLPATVAAPAPPPPAPTPVAAPAPAPMKKKIVLRGVNFDFDKADIRSVDEPILEEACEILKGEPNIDVSCDGYTDLVGSEEYNLALSQRRADAVRAWFTSDKCGLPASRLTAKGFGEANPVEDTTGPSLQNRRTELLVTND